MKAFKRITGFKAAMIIIMALLAFQNIYAVNDCNEKKNGTINEPCEILGN